jgi:hypothetical protein
MATTTEVQKHVVSAPLPASAATTTTGGGNNESTVLCASCDRCRARKTKCNGAHPCSGCVSKYMKKHKLESFDGIDHALVECHYSVARKRGPQPGSSKSPTAPRGSIPADGTTIYQQPAKKKPKKAKQAAPMMHDLAAMASAFGGGNLGQMPLPLDPAAAALQQQILSSLGAIGEC